MADSNRAVRLSRIQKDAELAVFITDRLRTDEVESIRQAAIERFSEHRVPSKSAVAHFVVAHRYKVSRK